MKHRLRMKMWYVLRSKACKHTPEKVVGDPDYYCNGS